MIGKNQIPPRFRRLINKQLLIYNSKQSVQDCDRIPNIESVPAKDKPIWYRIRKAICVYVDMLGSTKLSTELHKPTVVRAYHWYISTALQIFNRFNPQYINVHGDGVFAMFDNSSAYSALAAAITFKTFSHELFVPTILKTVGKDVGTHIGIDK